VPVHVIEVLRLIGLLAGDLRGALNRGGAGHDHPTIGCDGRLAGRRCDRGAREAVRPGALRYVLRPDPAVERLPDAGIGAVHPATPGGTSAGLGSMAAGPP